MAKGTTRPMLRRMRLILIVVLVIGFFAVTANLVKLQIVNYKVYQQKAIEQQTRSITINPQRGTIYDRNGVQLAVSAPAYMVYVVPSAIKKDTTRELIADNLSVLLKMDKSEINEFLGKKSYYQIIKRKIDNETMTAVEKFIQENNLYTCMNVAEDPKRYYPLGSFASHVIGATGNDNQGLSGLELYYNDYLKGVSGRIITATDAKGNVMPTDDQMYIEPQDGYNLTTTIDEVIQHFLDKHLKALAADTQVKNRSCGIVMDVTTGAVLAMSVQPDFDLNEPFTITDPLVQEQLKTYTGEEYKKMYSNAIQNMWRNKAINDQYIPGSVYKIITASTALEVNVVKFTDQFFCTGGVKVPGWGKQIRCDKRVGHGAENFLQGFGNSCNPVFIEVGQRIGIQNTMMFAQAYGLTKKTGIDLPGEGSGIFHNVSTMSIVDLATQSFGQNIKVTPIQMISSVAAAVNGGNLFEPYVVSEITDKDGKVIESRTPKLIRQVISEETSSQMRELLEYVVANGTGRNSRVEGYRIGGKTGTSEKTDEKNEEGIADKRIVSFCAVAPMDDPKIAILILLDEPTGSHVSGGTMVAPVMGDILEEVLPYLGVEPSYTEEQLAKRETTVPDITNITSAAATSKLKAIGLNVKLMGGEGTVTKQLPAANQRIPAGGTVLVYTNNEEPVTTVTVPNVIGLSASQANTELVNAGLNVKFSTANNMPDLVVGAVSPGVGTEVAPGTIVTVDLRLISDRD